MPKKANEKLEKEEKTLEQGRMNDQVQLNVHMPEKKCYGDDRFV